ncbi:MAG: flagellar biosynthesis anti-sigma factor FlgM [Bdellovibrio sp.]|nr:flagellar biosynthesis anti-sigma factor FlgM [Bdellovibrio sp.]
MKITHNKVGQNLNLSDSSKAEKAAEKGKASTLQDSKNAAAVQPAGIDATKVNLSARAQDLQQIKDLANSVPDVDQAKVDKFQKLIDAGKYKVDSKAVADRLVDEQMFSSGNASNE